MGLQVERSSVGAAPRCGGAPARARTRVLVRWGTAPLWRGPGRHSGTGGPLCWPYLVKKRERMGSLLLLLRGQGITLFILAIMRVLLYSITILISPGPLHRHSPKLMLLDKHLYQRLCQTSRIPAGDFWGHTQFEELLWDPCIYLLFSLLSFVALVLDYVGNYVLIFPLVMYNWVDDLMQSFGC